MHNSMSLRHATIAIAIAMGGFGALTGATGAAADMRSASTHNKPTPTVALTSSVPASAKSASSLPSRKIPAGWFHLRNEETNRCIDDSFQYGLRSFDCNNTSYQSWQPNGSAGDTPTYWRNSNTGRCIDDSFEAHLRSFNCNGLDYQKWWSISAPGSPDRESFQNQKTTGCIDDSFEFGLRSYGCNDGAWQHWYLDD